MSWRGGERGGKRLRESAAAVKQSKHLYLATDPDREGEAISWHIVDEMKRRNVLDGVNVERVVFNEITKKAVVEAFQHPRSLNQELIDAYMARRVNVACWRVIARSEEHTSELQSLMRISYAVFCLKKKKKNKTNTNEHSIQ